VFAKRVLVAGLLFTAMCAAPAAADTYTATCIALNTEHLEAGYLVSAEFPVYDPQVRDLATKDWSAFAASRGFESMGCDQHTYKEEIAALPADSKIVNTGWKPGHDTLLAGLNAIKSGKRNFRNGSDCVHSATEAITNNCGFPVSVAYCFRDTMSGNGDSFDKTCTAQKFGTLAALAAGASEKLGTYHYMYYFACEAPALPTALAFDGNVVSGVCSAP
jgi:hypothetical protein